jgi:PAS domain S-box-containing protein
MSDPARDDAYGTLFDHLPIGAYRSRPDGSLVRANLALATLNGFGRLQDLYPAVHDIGREWYVDASRRTLFRQLLERDGQVSGFVSEVRRYADGERIWVNENAHLRRCPAGRVAYYEGTVEDITARTRSQAAMASTELTMREVAEHIPGMVYRVHMPYATNWPAFYTFVSSGVRNLYGVEPEAVLLDPLVLRDFRHPDDVARVDAAVAKAMASNTPLNVAFRIVVGGVVKWVQMSSSTVAMDPHEQVRVGVVIDITAQRQAEALVAERAQVESERRQMMQFLSRVSHELRTPLQPRSKRNTATLARRLGQRRTTWPSCRPKASVTAQAALARQHLEVGVGADADVGRVVPLVGQRLGHRHAAAATRSRLGQCAKLGKLTMPMRPTRAVSRSMCAVLRRCCSVSSCSTTSKLASSNSARPSSRLSWMTLTPRCTQACTLASAISMP